VVCSEEFTVGAEYALFAEQVAGTAARADAPLVFSVPGATHPSFSDVFLILPEYVNKMTGLRIAAARVIELAVRATADFLAGRGADVVSRAVVYDPSPAVRGELTVADASENTGVQGEPEEVGKVPRPFRPVGTPGELVWHKFT
jgi:platelet-activating factor acetylhydrolase